MLDFVLLELYHVKVELLGTAGPLRKLLEEKTRLIHIDVVLCDPSCQGKRPRTYSWLKGALRETLIFGNEAREMRGLFLPLVNLLVLNVETLMHGQVVILAGSMPCRLKIGVALRVKDNQSLRH